MPRLTVDICLTAHIVSGDLTPFGESIAIDYIDPDDLNPHRPELVRDIGAGQACPA